MLIFFVGNPDDKDNVDEWLIEEVICLVVEGVGPQCFFSFHLILNTCFLCWAPVL